MEHVDWSRGTAAGWARQASRRPCATPRARASHGPGTDATPAATSSAIPSRRARLSGTWR